MWPHYLAPALRLVGVKELLSIGEAACADLINSTHIKPLSHKGLCCLRRRGGGGGGCDRGSHRKKLRKSITAVNYCPLTSQCLLEEAYMNAVWG